MAGAKRRCHQVCAMRDVRGWQRVFPWLHGAGAVALMLLAAGRVGAEGTSAPGEAGLAQAASRAFADNCYSPYMTAARAAEALASTGARVDFYDLTPFSSVAPSTAVGRAVTPGTDRRCEVAFDGADVAMGIDAATTGLAQEGIVTEAEVPADFTAQPGTEFIAARALNPNRIAVVQVGTQPGPNGIETFINVERLTPSNE